MHLLNNKQRIKKLKPEWDHKHKPEKHGMHRNKSSMFHFNFSPRKYDISSSYTSTIFSVVFVMSLTINSRDANEDL